MPSFRNPTTGEVVTWDGSAWVPAGGAKAKDVGPGDLASTALKSAAGTVAGAVTAPAKGLLGLPGIARDLATAPAWQQALPGGPLVYNAVKEIAGQSADALRRVPQSQNVAEAVSNITSAVPFVGEPARQIGLKLGAPVASLTQGQKPTPRELTSAAEGVGELAGNAALAGTPAAVKGANAARVGGLSKITEAILGRGGKIPERAFKYGKDPIRGLTRAMEEGMDVPLTRGGLKNAITGKITDLTDQLNQIVREASVMRPSAAPGFKFKPIIKVHEIVDEVIGEMHRQAIIPKDVLKRISKEGKNIVAEIGPRADLMETLEGKRRIQRATKYSGSDEVGVTLNDFRQKVASRLGGVVEARIPQNKVFDLNRKISDLIEAEKLVGKRGAGGSSIFSKIGQRALGAAAGTAFGGFPGGAIGAVAGPAVLSSPALQALIARALKGKIPAASVTGAAATGALEEEQP